MFKRYISWPDDVWSDYTHLKNIKYVKRINKLIKSIERDGFSKGLGKPEILKHYAVKTDYKAWSRRINDQDRLIYLVTHKNIVIISIKGHYE